MTEAIETNISIPDESFLDSAVHNKANYQQVCIITLNEGQHLESQLYHLKKGWILEFHKGPSLFGRNIFVFTNHPISNETFFERDKFYKLDWKAKDPATQKNKVKDDTSFYAQLTVTRAGSFNYYFIEESEECVKNLGSGYFNVSPVLYSRTNHDLLLNSIQCQTVLAKCLGPFSEWENRLLVSKESGYNMIHFTPIQELGGSNSSYSIKDQLQLNPTFSDLRVKPSFDNILELISKLQQEWGVLCISDVVLNHTANESPWLFEHPECTYNMVTAPHLIPAAILDGYLHVFNKNVASGRLLNKGIPSEICTENHLQAIKFYLETELIPSIRLEEYHTCDVDKLGQEFRKLAEKTRPKVNGVDAKELKLIHKSSHGRNQATIDLDLALNIFYTDRLIIEHGDQNGLSVCVHLFKNHLNNLNADAKRIVSDHLAAAVNNCIAHIRYQRVLAGGPKIRKVCITNPLVPRYFTGDFSEYDSIEEEVLQKGQYVMAHNGWVMNFDPLKNFASSDSAVYLRRELIAWGDSVKLRYGDAYADCPFLWDHMRKYVEKTAQIFHGIRLDNCHSTPLPVAEYLLDCARRIRPDLFVVAELFTNSDATDNIFINRLGITSLVREAMSAWNSHELGRLVYRYGGDPVGSFYISRVRPVVPSIAHALLYDVTHDNESPIERKSVFDSLASSAMVAMACCATGSTRGFDELVPHHVHVVDENRLYASWTFSEVLHPGQVNSQSGIIPVKKVLNLLHCQLNDEGYSEVYVDQMNENIVAVTRHNPITHNSVILVSYTAFSYPPENLDNCMQTKNLKVEGIFTEILLEASLKYDGESYTNQFPRPENFVQDSTYVNGLSQYKVEMKENIRVEESSMLKLVPSQISNFTQYEFVNFTPGSIIIVKMSLNEEIKKKLEYIVNVADSLIEHKCGDLNDIITNLSLGDLNFALYRCSEEDLVEGNASYNVPGYGSLVYCGLQGFSSVLQDIRYNNDLGHPFCENLRQGNWMLDYISGRLKGEANTRQLGLWFERIFEALRSLPRYLIPRYFDVIVTSVTNLLLSRATFQMSKFVRCGSTFVRALAMGSVQCVGAITTAALPPFSPALNFACPEIKNMIMSAGLPHFTSGFMRSWGRDTFISLRGLLLITGRYEVARCHILGYASCLRHGLIPNLLDCGVNARYNCRDAVWWWLYSIVSYIKLAPNGVEILNDPVSRMFPKDDSTPVGSGLADQPLHDVMQEALSVHFQGLEFRERNAGSAIDVNMSDAGFNNKIGVDLNTGFIYGGNEHNCGTWMDKMGSSSIAGNYGRPATPRDGSAVELVGLSKAVLHELGELYNAGIYPYSSVERITAKGEIMKWTFKEWEDKISSNFDEYFWVDDISETPKGDSHLVHRRGIYKDTVGATQPWADYQLRCNFLIALTVAPDMTDPEKAWKAIKKAEEILLGPLGIKTLDPADWNYRGNYSCDDNSDDSKVAHGFNYHQGPEWLWPVGFFLRAKLHFSKARSSEELKRALRETKSYLGKFYEHIMTSHWRGLPELTNANGAYCPSSCRVQAWSMGCILEVLYDIDQLCVE